MPPPANTALKHDGQWSRPPFLLKRGVRPNSCRLLANVEGPLSSGRGEKIKGPHVVRIQSLRSRAFFESFGLPPNLIQQLAPVLQPVHVHALDWTEGAGGIRRQIRIAVEP